MKRYAFVIQFFLFLILFNGCTAIEKNTKVVFLLPDGYRGAFKLIEDQNGKVIKSSLELIEITVPTDGVVRLQKLDFIRKWHKVEAKLRKGNNDVVRLPDGNFSELESKRVAFFSLWTESDGDTYYFVGTKEEYENALEAGPWETGHSQVMVPIGRPAPPFERSLSFSQTPSRQVGTPQHLQNPRARSWRAISVGSIVTARKAANLWPAVRSAVA